MESRFHFFNLVVLILVVFDALLVHLLVAKVFLAQFVWIAFFRNCRLVWHAGRFLSNRFSGRRGRRRARTLSGWMSGILTIRRGWHERLPILHWILLKLLTFRLLCLLHFRIFRHTAHHPNGGISCVRNARITAAILKLRSLLI